MSASLSLQSPWHAGEQALHGEAGIAARMAEVGARALRDQLPEQHRLFFAELPVVYAGLLDDEGQPWASLLAGPPGFVSSPWPQRLRIAARPLRGDPAAAHWRVGAPVALLGLQAETGRRNRMNGRIASEGGGVFALDVGQSFGNCPKYIHPRRAGYQPAVDAVQGVAADRLDAAARRIVAHADTFFIASAHPQARQADVPAFGLDVSHRGGPPGFVRVEADGSLLAPDYAGNSFFNTLGNLRLEPRCGLLFVDFATGERVHLACRAELLAQRPDPAQWPGALRLLRFEVGWVLRARGGLPLRWQDT